MLERITPLLIETMNERHAADGGTAINEKLDLVFSTFADNTCPYDVRVRVAVLNTIYNTAIQYILPVVETINREFQELSKSEKTIKTLPTEMVDRIATAEWNRKESDKIVVRTNLSFASKYMHFESKRAVPIYDSYIWIIMNGYLHAVGERGTFRVPSNYAEFHARFQLFRQRFDLGGYSNYQIDKFLWQYGKAKIGEYVGKGLPLAKAKARLKSELLNVPFGIVQG